MSRLTDAEWRDRLSAEQYRILRQAGTEPPGSGDLLHNKGKGAYRCAGCGAELFASDTKYDSGSGWPSFSEPASDGAVDEHVDHSHGMRYCINSASLDFDPDEAND